MPPPPLRMPEPGGGALQAERQLVAAIERAVRAPQGWSAVALHLSRLAPPGPRPHHRRIARAVMQDAAQRIEGQIFALRNGDVVLLYRGTMPASAVVPETLRRLFGREVDDPETIVSEWHLPHAGARLLAYTAERIAEADTPGVDEGAAPPVSVADTVAAAVGVARPYDLVRRQAAVLLEPASRGAGVTMRQLYRELSFSLDVVEARTDASLRLGRDRDLLRHLGRHFDQRMLRILASDRGSATPLDLAATSGRGASSGDTGMAIHLNLSLPGVLSEDFAVLADVRGAGGPALGVVVPLLEAVADPAAYGRARERLWQAGAPLVLDGVSHLTLLLARPAALQADLIKLEWSPGIAELAGEDAAELARAIAEADPSRLVLDRADSENAVRWGLAHGMRRFQGRHIDQMLAAQRMLECRGAPACTLRQCVQRMHATGGPIRADCTNLKLLDAGLPAALAASERS